MKIALLVLVLILLPSVYAICSEGQIDINTASLEELDEFYGIGPAKAQAIIDSRPFDSIDDLIKVPGIGEITLSKIKDQGLACVVEETNNLDIPEDNTPPEEEINGDSEEEEVEEEDRSDEADTEEEKVYEPLSVSNINPKNEEPKIINLNPQTLKDDESENIDKTKYAMYGFVMFCVLLGLLFILRKNKYNKNEFG